MNEQPHRLAPVALLILWVKNVVALWPIFVGGLFSMFGSKMSFKELLFWLALILGSVTLMLGWSILRYLRFTYLVAPDGLTIQSGVFIRKTNHIPYDRIQTVQRQQWFFLKPLGLEQVSIETAGKETRKAEGQLAAVPTAVADTINRYRQGIGPESATSTTTKTTDADADAATRTRVVNTEPVPDAAYKINSHDLNQYALTSLGFIPIITGILWVLDKAQEYLPDSWYQQAEHAITGLAIYLLIGLSIIVLVLGFAVSYLNILQKYYRFTLDRTGNELRTSRGFFQTNTVSARLSRVQAVRFKQSILRQWFHLTTVQALLASGAADDEQNNDLVLMPVIRQRSAMTDMRKFISWLPTTIPELQPIPVRNRWYYVRNMPLGNLAFIVAPIILASVLWLHVSWWVWLLPIGGLWLLIMALQGQYAATNAAIAIAPPDQLVIQVGEVWTRQRYYVRKKDIQAMSLAQSIWMKPCGVAHLNIHVRKGNSDQTITSRYMKADLAKEILSWYQPLP
ncbi:MULTISPECIES: PH domain-containing protein [Lacticaseibacillus]|uniref:YdbS-like PH domain-containing protein n=1 Tax=Lacticaseibacillus casei DSM 20011 = JCM 1134 = ATCC 393 TaxID=1423732 RepID=A0AAD1ASP6_LACCA|nr:PH domain-containing protein [Lacticaseibacillus casei]HAJ54867.1 hypothetical protein [Lactobacillus sp.]MBI6598333.1 PH domain-containing protein [Lacticaseibacillus casei]MBO1482072.1 PH domain-containing protein [Lacticaseibacillus casei]MBO2417324.1 PH domain-containing protein [Lacticaseibacillus casei]MCK2081626.1 PH domain-containing protein [Lacticaseibacillus casei]